MKSLIEYNHYIHTGFIDENIVWMHGDSLVWIASKLQQLPHTHNTMHKKNTSYIIFLVFMSQNKITDKSWRPSLRSPKRGMTPLSGFSP